MTLTGWVDSHTKRWAAEDAAHRIKGVKALANDIEVRLSTSDEETDQDIAKAVVRALEWDAFIPIDNHVLSHSEQARVRAELAIEWGMPTEEILRYAKEHEIDLIAMVRTAAAGSGGC